MWKNVRIKTRLYCGFSILLVLFIASGWFSLHEVRTVANIGEELFEHPLEVSNDVRDVHVYIVKMLQCLSDAIIMTGNDIHLNSAIHSLEEMEKAVYGELKIINERFLGDKERVDKFVNKFEGWAGLREAVLKLVKEGKREEAAQLLKGPVIHYVTEMEWALEYFADFAAKKADQFINDSRYIKQTIYKRMLIFSLVIIIISIMVTYSITMSITRPLRQAVEVAKHLAMNDLSIEIEEAETRDETGMLLGSMKEMLATLRKQTRDLLEGVSVVAGSALQISTTTTQFATSFNEIAAAINETVTSMKEVKQTSELSSEKARDVAEGARNVLLVSRDGEKSVNETIAAMNGIREQMGSIAESIVGLSEQTQSIGEIIAFVDDIAVQGRLLSVNASIEAIKAGEQGKGFSVVAAEIKNQVTEAKLYTNQVRSILSEIQKAMGNSVMVTEKGNKSVDNGVKQATKTGQTIQALGQSIQEAAQASMQIEATVRQQLAGIDQVFTAMENINTATIQNAEGARQLETAARNLEELGRKLKSLAQNYKL